MPERVLSFWFIASVTLLSTQTASLAAEPSLPTESVATLRLPNGDFVAGHLSESTGGNTLRWQGAAFTTSFDYPLNTVSAVHFPMPDDRPIPTGDYCFELAGGDLLFGSLVGFTAEQAAVDVPRFGLVHLRRQDIRRMLRWRDGAHLVYLGPNGLRDWIVSPPEKGWREEAGHLVTDQDGASITGKFDVPVQASIEFEVSWSAKPDFVLALDAGRVSFEQAFRFEVWNGNLVFLRETETDADLAGLEEIGTVAGRAHFQVYLDQQSHRALVFSSAGEQLADLSVAGGKPFLQPTIRLINKRGDIRLERLRIGRWDGQPPRDVRADKSRIHLADGTIIYGELTGFDAAAGEFIVNTDDSERRFLVDDVGSIVLSSPDGLQPRQVRAVFQDGVRLSGELTKVDGERVWLNCPSVVEPLRLPASELHTLMVLVSERTKPSADGRAGRLEADGVKLSGILVDGRKESGASCFVWRPHGSATASALREGCSARVVYRESLSRYPRTAVPTPRVAPPHRQVGGLLGQLAQALAGASSSPSTTVASRPSSGYDPCLYLRTGDTIPCSVERIDEKGVSFRSSVFDATFVTNDKIKAVELENRSRGIRINRSKRDRLLTLPRMQKNNPPTHLIRSTSGDYLRARLNEMNDETLTVEVRLETRRLPRRYVSQIIWLHEGELGSTEKVVTASALATRVQALRDDGIRLTFIPEELIDSNLCGTSDVLGPCRVALSEVDQLLIGGAIEDAAPALAYQRWRLQPAVEPKFVDGDSGSAARAPGTESALVGKPAPDFKLDLLDGESFRLSDHQGNVVVLDFWATWCGPCIQAMPEVDRVVNEFREQDVELIAVNLQDAADAITATLDRIELDTTVALDLDGVVAEKYTVTAIPQTVIVDREGKIARLFVGGGAQLADQLREALDSVLADGD